MFSRIKVIERQVIRNVRKRVYIVPAGNGIMGKVFHD
jgi:hypothetical protein